MGDAGGSARVSTRSVGHWGQVMPRRLVRDAALETGEGRRMEFLRSATVSGGTDRDGELGEDQGARGGVQA